MSFNNDCSKFSVALFGPQRTPLTSQGLADLQTALKEDPRLEFLRQTLDTLPSLWSRVKDTLDSQRFEGASKLQKLQKFAAGSSDIDFTAFSNIELAVLTVATQVVDLIQQHGTSLDKFEAAQGFCIGFLSAASYATARDWNEFEKNISNAIRLAACIGIVVDVEQVAQPVTAFSAYISCITDDKNITITIPQACEKAFIVLLSEAGISTTTIGLRGSYHSQTHQQAARTLSSLCEQNDNLRLPTAEQLRRPLRSTADADLITTGALHDIAIELILVRRANWFWTVKNTIAHCDQHQTELVSFGSESCIPRSMTIRSHQSTLSSTASGTEEIAVVGMSCRFARSENLEEFWRLLDEGGTGIGKIPSGRFDAAHLTRGPKLDNYWGNFIAEPDVFDHKFFGISGREAKSMDPQQRLALQVAYEALASSGYCSKPAETSTKDVGCYLGVGAVDYEDNVASKDANAFAATGTLRAFISGRISHFFGWDGPSLTVDTACSSSAVAIHTACKALLGGECSMALAGGVNVITSPSLHQNLAGASFLNPNGSSRAFDANAGGYCRGEGAGIVVLKKLSAALADGDAVIGVIASSAVNQGSNCSPITVPHSDSQSNLYKRVLKDAGVKPEDVTYVEAHGTGTQVGDPIEYESVRSAFTGPLRTEELFIGSVKDNIGHAEAASGAAGVIKCLLMMQHNTIPKQANFTSLNPKIKTLPQDGITVPKSSVPWTSTKHIALVNNYGAAGSNAAILIRAYPDKPTPLPIRSPAIHPILLSAKTASSLASYTDALKLYLSKERLSLESVAYNLAQSHDVSFDSRIGVLADDLDSAVSALGRASANDSGKTAALQRRPVVLCFGGQTGRQVTISKDLYENSDLLKKHLDECDSICRRLGLGSIFPGIFQDDAIQDTLSLHCRLLSLQVSCARCWIDSGLEVDTLIGHSFGQLTALCVAGSVSLEDTFRLVAGRARLVRDGWGPEHGAMLAVECDREELDDILSQVNSTDDFKLDVACYNGPRSFVLAGGSASIAKAVELCRGLKSTELRNTHAYHSYLADGILDDLSKLAASFKIQAPRIRIETCSAGETWTDFTSDAIVQHTRQPVYFSDAVGRIAKRLPAAIWVEAGSATPILAMAKRAIAKPDRSDVFVPMQLGAADAVKNLAKSACDLWKAGSAAQYWPFHRSSAYRYKKLNIPPYQFEKTSHWLSLEPRSVGTANLSKAPELVKLVKDGRSTGEYVLVVNTAGDSFQLSARGHAVTGQSLCPASMYMEMVAQSAKLVSNHADAKKYIPHIEGLTMLAPLGISEAAVVFVRLHQVAPESWDFIITSQASASTLGSESSTKHASGSFTWQISDDSIAKRRLQVLSRLGASRTSTSAMATGVRGAMVYKLFSDVVDYADYYRGVQSISASDNEATGMVKIPLKQHRLIDTGICDPIILDNFLQVAGIHTNCLSTRDESQVLMCTSVDEIIFSPSFLSDKSDAREWLVHTRFEKDSPANVRTNDIFVCNAKSGDLVMAVLGANFRGVPFRSLAKSLTRLNKPSAPAADPDMTSHDAEDSGYASERTDEDKTPAHEVDLSKIQIAQVQSVSAQLNSEKSTDALASVQKMFSEIIEISIDEVAPSSSLDDLGIDSLLITEVLAEINTRFGIRVTQAELSGCVDVRAVSQLVSGINTRGEPKQPEIVSMEIATQKAIGATSSKETGFYATVGAATAAKNVPNLAAAGSQVFTKTIPSYDKHADTTGFTDFYTEVFPTQSALVVQYVLTAFSSLGCDLGSFADGAVLPSIQALPKHTKVMLQLHEILTTAGLLSKGNNGEFQRTGLPIPTTPASALKDELLQKFPKHTSETKLLHSTGHKLAECLTGKADPVSILFGDSAARDLLGDVYTNAPMFKTGTLQLAEYLSSVLGEIGGKRELRILELGAGTGGTTKNVVETLFKLGHKFTYTFTDLSSSLVVAAKRKFSKWSFMEYKVMDIEKDPQSEFLGKYDIILSTNCIHATRDLIRSTTHIRQMLKPDGLLCLVELTRNLYWFDLVFGLLEGWWLSSDGRWHALATEELWKKDLLEAGFKWVDWSRSSTKESELLRVITASPCEPLARLETLPFKEVDGQQLYADMHYPAEKVESGKKLPVALMIHGGGHIMLSRSDIRPDQTDMLLESGFLAISIDYRLCPEVTLSEGPMVDVVDALHWIRTKLPELVLSRPDIAVDASKVVAVGWSTGGHLATTLAWTSKARHVQAPEAILALYCPLDYEDKFWMLPNIPEGAAGSTVQSTEFDLDDEVWTSGVFDAPITRYNVSPTKKALGGWLAPSDPRSRLALFMNCRGRSLHVLLNGLDKKARKEPAEPTQKDIVAVSPLAQVRAGTYKTPTFILHPREDDLIPWQQAERTWQALQDMQVDSELRIVEGVPHLFDLAGLHRVRNEDARRAMVEGYEFLCRHVGLTLRT
ncbi:beta-ketoacyl synthase domain-containing protein [Diaporthe amygdali]|uniref:beta-ketoacyl synthase domain-containing protein n=1 Tax=Phomopsis amygdali TaxID=1214568 RepID=UPI0022FE7C0D|nr:beta-ketoacyl synthase domain-containing protein [Diaporthe amygdali]KAJ0108719.1 beta-ketoacyl synthase domain-containing protein [Diaporthe amygdali]